MGNTFSQTFKKQLGNLFQLHRVEINAKVNNESEFIDFIKRNNLLGSYDTSSCILRATLNNYTECVKLFLETRTGDINYKDSHGDTALIASSINNNIDILQRLLVYNKSNINNVNNIGNTALIEASIRGNLKPIIKLVENDADVSVVNKDGNTAFMEACKNNKLNVVKFFLDSRKVLDINQLNKHDQTALILSVSPNRDSNEIIEFLIKNGANVNCKAKYVPSALLQAVIVKNSDVVQTLIKYRANVNDTFGSDNFTALMQACLEGSDLIVYILLKNDANVNMINSTGMSALNFATEYINRYPERKLKFLNIIKMLIEHHADITDKIVSSIHKINDRNIRNTIFLLIKQNSLEDYLLLFEHAKKPLAGGEYPLLSQFKEQVQGSDILYTEEVLPYVIKREPDSGKQRRKRSKKKRSKRSKKRSCRRHIVR